MNIFDSLDLQLFSGETEAQAPEEQEAVTDEEVPAAASAESTDRGADGSVSSPSWQDVLKNPEFKKNISAIVSGRLAKANSENAALKKELEELRRAAPGASAPAEEATAGEPDRSDGTETPGAGSLESRLQTLEDLIRRREEERERQSRDRQLRLHFEELRRQGEELQRQLPDFSLESALEDKDFLRLTSPEVGLGVESAWYALHHDRLRQEAAGEAARAVSESIRSGAGIPAENGTVQRGAVSSQPRLYRNMSPEERKLQEKLILSGTVF